ncbi:helix-turn-helix transcriptional regulator [Chryseobacterium bernardetii]|uniref:helix-turn-helix domain-containing protein n=1 Tax=Chryseobacterium bernardetii TaxID=1241978 RepID=UPI001627F069|nr:helix-turn-helix transcriptional regulator [Chryseobacterium bernardetii]
MARKQISENDRIRQVLVNKYNIKLTDLASKMGISYPVFSKKLNVGTLTTLKEIEKYTGISVIEMQNAPAGFFHYYDPDTGEWGGIWKKNS